MLRIIQLLILVPIFAASAACFGQIVSSETQLGDPTEKAQFYLSKKTAVEIYNPQAGEVPSETCQMGAASKGSVVASSGRRRLLVFDDQDWKTNCKKQKGPKGIALGWVDESDLKPIGLTEAACEKMSCALERYGNRCAAFEFLESEIEKAPAVKPGGCSAECSPLKAQESTDQILDIAKTAMDVTSFQLSNRCLVEGNKIDKQVSCDFNEMLSAARDCTNGSRKPVLCPKEVCWKRLNKMACENSPWRKLDLEARFHLIQESANKYSARYGVDPRMLICLAGNETGSFEPNYKNLMACEDPIRNSYHGLGMLTLGTLKDYLNPLRELRGVKKNGKGVSEISPAPKFRSQNPLFKKLSYYACPEKLHSVMAASPELQIELMAYTVGQKLVSSQGSEHKALAYYNGLATPDANGQPHMDNYADSAMACTQCMRENILILGERRPSAKKKAYMVKSPVECLSITMRSGSPSGFHMIADKKVFSDFEDFGKHCEGGR